MDAPLVNFGHVRRRLTAPLLGLALLPLAAFSQPSPPPLPEESFLDSYDFQATNWPSFFGDAPAASTNLVLVPSWNGHALLLDTTNLLPAFLNYNIVETNGYTNLTLDAGAIECIFITTDWSSTDTNQNGTGPGETGYLLAAGDSSSGAPDGLWAIYVNSAGTAIYFAGVSNSTSTVYVSAPISWPSNSFHVIGLIYSTTTSLYIDGQLAGTGGPVTIVPATNTWTNGFMVGSFFDGYEQARSVFCRLQLYDSNFYDSGNGFEFTNRWPFLSNAYASWQGGGGSGPDSSPSSPGSLVPSGGSSDCVTGTAVYITNMSYAVIPGQGNTFTFTIAGGIPDFGYDVFSTTNLARPLANTVARWLGQGTNCGIYAITNQPNTPMYYFLGSELDANGSGLTMAYENLISTNFSSDGYGTPNAWYLWHGINPQTSGIGANDPDGDGLVNYQEYLYGTNPQVSEGFGIWVSEPELTSGIP